MAMITIQKDQRIGEYFYQVYDIRREVSKPADLINLLLARLLYDIPVQRSKQTLDLVQRISKGEMIGLEGAKAAEFSRWVRAYLEINRTVKGETFLPVHPALTLSFNGEHVRADRFVSNLAQCFTSSEREKLLGLVWDIEQLPQVERVLYELITWQVEGQPSAAPSTLPLSVEPTQPAQSFGPEGILARLKEDILLLADSRLGIQNFSIHSSRLLAFAQVRYMLAKANFDFSLPIYAAPAADTHEGVKTLAHEIIEVHRARLAQGLEAQFRQALQDALQLQGLQGEPADEVTARQLVRQLFHPNANIVREGTYDAFRSNNGSFVQLALDYYWSQGSARNRFMRQLHATHLSMAKKAGFANSRSRYSQWHFYWLAPGLVETLLLVSEKRLGRNRILMSELLDDWRRRYDLALLIDPSWEDAYRRDFRGLGSPDALNEVNRRRFMEILGERGRLHKNSDDFPWVVLRD